MRKHLWLEEKNDKTAGPVVSVMFWGCITFEGVGTFVPVDGNINSQKYTDILDENLWPVRTNFFRTDPGYFRMTMPHLIVLDTLLTGNRETIFLEWYGQHKARILMSSKIYGGTLKFDCRRWCIGSNVRMT